MLQRRYCSRFLMSNLPGTLLFLSTSRNPATARGTSLSIQLTVQRGRRALRGRRENQLWRLIQRS